MKSGKLHAAAVTPAVKPSQPEQQLLLHCKLRLPMLRLMKRKEKCWGGPYCHACVLGCGMSFLWSVVCTGSRQRFSFHPVTV